MSNAEAQRRIAVETEIDLDEGQKGRIVSMVLGYGHVDHYHRFTDRASGQGFEIAKIHFTLDQSRAVDGSATKIAGVDGIRFHDVCHMILEDTEGGEHGMDLCRAETKSSWHCGAVFEVDGEAWFCGFDQPSGQSLDPEAPVLKKVHPQASLDSGESWIDLLAELPAEGEFWISQEEEPRVTSCPWWGSLDQSCPEEAECLERMVERVKNMARAPEPGI